MTKIPRRSVLGGLGLIGFGSVAGGVGTRALLSDTEEVAVIATAGELDIQLDWKAFHNGTQIAMQAPADTSGQVAAHFTDIKPGDAGCFSLSIHNETNPAYVWLAMDIEHETDGGDQPQDDPHESECPPVEYPWVCGQTTTDGSVTIANDGGTLIVEIESASGQSLGETHLHITDSIESIPGGPSPGQFDYSHENIDATTDTYEIPFENSNYSLSCGDTPVIAVHAEELDGEETCWAGATEVNSGQGGSWALAIDHTIDCCSPTELAQPAEEYSLADRILLDAFWDTNGDCKIDSDDTVLFRDITLRNLANNIAPSTGGIMPEWDIDGTQNFSLLWRIPKAVGNEIQGDELTISFHAYAEQRRHNVDPTNPWV
ncbi:hypothetical protein C464_13310 [Halorubrum coriense DSM 10284]|uniref:von Willebrand factor type A n=1 Tax=Halorubrum coriense DSM 10284 TaxID=1227466 RepID=M0EC76_9EURY|nr:hypothetical protein [Halorubrum coriense]ELZ44477.1 hypothetical protein C464_13310 [Halorubrum coriense DSM 10284]